MPDLLSLGVTDDVSSVLPRQTIWDLIHQDPPLASGLLEPDQQVQPCGLDVTLGAVFQLTEAGRLGVDERHLPDRVPMAFDFWGWLHLAPGSYMIQLNEVVRLPLDVMALGQPRSSLLRCGASIGPSAVWDPGYEGRSECLLTVHNPAGIELQKDARIMQLVFFRLEEATVAGYSGRYQGENLR
ncbi:MAG TPA: deoxyuridine 5'-triphosphate nucleotidohydrolase [Chloroflexota bacterium]|jgi:dUTP pyrophosphatase|nr:deoxyuridine 5'-triphosphate nucleotidohydrolase [Chloroflexota bacterium]